MTGESEDALWLTLGGRVIDNAARESGLHEAGEVGQHDERLRILQGALQAGR
jgi:hypothetical protein